MYSNPDLENKLVEHEGIRKFAYTDTVGKITVGIGRNIDKDGEGLSVDECFYLMRNDIDRRYRVLMQYDWFKMQNDARQGALIELAFNLGINGLLEFKDVIAALNPLNPGAAYKALNDSKWATEVSPARSKDICSRILYGRYL